jgi:hypothetical protein
VECTKNRKQKRRIHKEYGKNKTRHYDITRNEEKTNWGRNITNFTYVFMVELQKKKEQSEEDLF